jgi:thiaminase
MDLMNKSRGATGCQMAKAIHMVAKERNDVESGNNILERIAFDVRMVELTKNSSKYETLEWLKVRFSKRIATTDEGIQYINYVLKTARAETVHKTDVALITCARSSNQFFS